jgi:hypothetical protein
MSEGKGDLDWNGKYLEVKGSGARLGSRGNSSSILTNIQKSQFFSKL